MKYLCFLLLCCSFTLTTLAQNYSYLKYSASEGLPQSQVFDITQDKDGYIWVGTFGGLAKFNGIKFETYTSDNGLFNNRISFIEFIDDKLYVGHEGGISIGVNRKFIQLSLPQDAKTSKVTSIQKFNQQIYVATNGGGLFKIVDFQIQKIDKGPQYIRDLIVLEDELYLAARRGLFSLQKDENLDTLIYDTKISFTGISKSQNTLYLSAYNGHIYQYKNSDLKSIYSSNIKFRGVLFKNNKLWCYSPSGVTQINLTTEQSIKFTEKNGLETPDINAVYIDREDNLWLGSSGKGLLRFSGEAFTYFKKNERLSSDLILSILETKSGEYFFSTFDAELTHWIDDTTTSFLPIGDGFVWSSVERENGDIFFGTNKGVYWHDKSEDFWKRYYGNNQLPSAKITALYLLADNSTVLAGGKDGFSRIVNDSVYIDSSLIENNLNVKGFTQIGDDIYVLGKKSLYNIQGKVAHEILRKEDYSFTSIRKDDNNDIWLGAEQGLFLLQGDSLLEIELDKNKGASFTFFIEAYKHYIYIGTNNGLYRYNIYSHEIKHYGLNEGLIDLEANINAVYVDSKKQLWFGTASGLMKLDLNKEDAVFTQARPVVQISEIKLTKTDKDITQYCDSLTPLGLPVNLELPYKLNGINIKLDGLFYSNPKGVEFAYQLVSEDSLKWTPLDAASTITFPNLNFGEYTLLIKAKSINGQESEVKSFQFKILKPYYFTTWFITTIILILISIVLAILYANNVRIKKKIARKQYEEQLESRTKLARLEQQSLNASMNRHFIFNSLNSIQYYINANDKLSANRFLTRFAKLIRKNLDSSHEKNGLVKLADEMERLKLYMDLERMRFTDKFDYSIEIEEGIDLESIDVPAMLLQPFVENSIIHGVLPRHDDQGHIHVSIKKQETSFVVEIFDNGVGIDVSKVNKVSFDGDHNSHGMEITSKRIEILKKLTERNIELKGPQQINENDGTIKGTSVWIRIDNNNLSVPD
ncbi:Two component regulator propeller [Lishizhenia tianjinensis]|uniref:Two component regulator propeller n=1 Tax=Lishizhenia tianjinensis TaxID=477690 RepID=A0A1I6ZS84_9FLAO|nr:two-component regulator propeller domain-containing protein [Lishizhenia tianjinensis]SFT65467.1 Two component regulator propeller [Lishizhenia tianjinensis]